MNGTLLIVDDDHEIVRTFGDWLRREGCEVRTAADGEQALGQVDGADALIVDLRMPLLDGLGFLRSVRARGQQTPAAIVTGDYTIDDDVLQEFTRLNVRVQFKPLWLDEFVALVAALLDQAVVQ
jgi:DNA-binding NtrC family response regulator